MQGLSTALKIFLILSGLLSGATPLSLWAQLDWSQPSLEITQRDGLPSTYVKGFSEDAQGFIWILTYKGLCRFDGSQLEWIQDSLLPTEGYTELIYDPDEHTLWVGTITGLYAYHLHTGHITRFGPESPLGEDHVLCMALDQNRSLWIGTRTALLRLNLQTRQMESVPIELEDEQRPLYTYNEIKAIQADPARKERLWISTTAGLVRYETSTQKAYAAWQELGNVQRLGVNQFFISPTTGWLYLGIGLFPGTALGYHYLVYDPMREEALPPVILPEAGENRSMVALTDSVLLFSTSKGLYYFHEGSRSIIQSFLNVPNSALVYHANFVDSRAQVWSATRMGIRMYHSDAFAGQNYYYEAAFPDWYHIASGLYYDTLSHSVFMPVFGGEGLYQFDLTTRLWRVYPFLDERGQPLKTDFAGVGRLRDGRLLISGSSGWYQLSQNGRIERLSLPWAAQSKGMKAHWDSRDALWITTLKGVDRVDFATQKIQYFRDEIHFCDLYSGEGQYFEDSRGNVWIHGFCDGFDMYEQATGRIHGFDISPYSDGHTITGIDELDGFVWALVDNGDILILDLAQLEQGITEVIPLKSAVAQGQIQFVNKEPFETDLYCWSRLDQQGRLWFLTRKGLYCYDQTQARIERFDETVGINVKDPEMNVFVGSNLLRLPDGHMVFATRKGICLFHPDRLSNQMDLPIPYIRSLSINNEVIRFDSSTVFKRQYFFSPNENFIGIDFSALSFNQPEEGKFLYKMTGVNEEWQDPGDKRFVSYTQLSGGSYTFELKAANSAGIWSGNQVRLQFEIDKFWYHKNWARALFALGLVGLIVFVYISRLRRAIEKEQVKTRYERDLAELKMQALTAQMNPHFMFNSLNSIDYYIIKNDTKKASQYLNRFSRLMRLILKNSRSNYVSLQDDLDALRLYLEIESLRFKERFEFEIKLGENIDPDFLKIPPMLVQPYVENSIWHGLLHKKGPGKIRVHYELDDAQEVLTCTVIDNGIGRKKSQELKARKELEKTRKSFGMNITRDKIEVLKYLHGIDAKVAIIDLYDLNNQSSGTRVELTIPV